MKPEKLWGKLYEYRSIVAHGSQTDFESNLKCLKDPATALSFITSATVSVFRQMLEEPELLADLREC
jgi:hypothetical protein